MQMEISGNCAGAPTWRAENIAHIRVDVPRITNLFERLAKPVRCPIRREEMSPTPPGESRRSIAPAATQTLERHATNVGAAATISSAPAGTFLR